jgi:hypothetical protein
MARNDPFTPDFVNVADTNSTTFDGSSGGTGTAIVSGMYADFDAEIYIEASNDGGTSWTQISQLTDENGNTTFTSSWHTQFNRVMISSGSRRIRVDNVTGDSGSGEVAIDGDER